MVRSRKKPGAVIGRPKGRSYTQAENQEIADRTFRGQNAKQISEEMGLAFEGVRTKMRVLKKLEERGLIAKTLGKWASQAQQIVKTEPVVKTEPGAKATRKTQPVVKTEPGAKHTRKTHPVVKTEPVAKPTRKTQPVVKTELGAKATGIVNNVKKEPSPALGKPVPGAKRNEKQTRTCAPTQVKEERERVGVKQEPTRAKTKKEPKASVKQELVRKRVVAAPGSSRASQPSARVHEDQTPFPFPKYCILANPCLKGTKSGQDQVFVTNDQWCHIMWNAWDAFKKDKTMQINWGHPAYPELGTIHPNKKNLLRDDQGRPLFDEMQIPIVGWTPAGSKFGSTPIPCLDALWIFPEKLQKIIVEQLEEYTKSTEMSAASKPQGTKLGAVTTFGQSTEISPATKQRGQEHGTKKSSIKCRKRRRKRAKQLDRRASLLTQSPPA